jgi:hypothetical protein
MIVHRVEDKEGKGPYNSDHSVSQSLKERHVNLDRAPTPYNDGMGSRSEAAWSYSACWRFAFKTEADLQRWFTPYELKRLQRVGFKRVEYTVSTRYINSGGKQCAFNRTKSTKGDSHPLVAI